MNMFQPIQTNFTNSVLRQLGEHEDKTSLDKWFDHLRSNFRTSSFKDVLDLEWSSLSTDPNRGFMDTEIGGKKITAVS